MITPVDKEKCKAIAQRHLEAARFARRAADIQKNLTFVCPERKGKHVRRVMFSSVRYIHSSYERVAADNEREFIALWKNSARHPLKRNVGHDAANGAFCRKHYRVVGVFSGGRAGVSLCAG